MARGFKAPKRRKALSNLGQKYATNASPAQPGAQNARARLFADKLAPFLPKPPRRAKR